MLNVSHVEKNNYVNGNGCRYVIWVQGCNFKCEGCWNKHTWDSNIKNLRDVQEIFNDIVKLDNIDGVTFTGGEPLLQADELLVLATLIKEKTNLSIHIFTGFELIEERTDMQNNLIKMADTVVFGRYNKTLPNNNQTVINYTSDRWNYNNSDVEIDINDDLELLFTGYPKDSLIKTIKENLE